MKNDNILEIMVSHHALLETLFSVWQEEIEKSIGNPKASLGQLQWEMEKHFFVEENAIFDFTRWQNSVIAEMVDHLKKDHHNMLESLKGFFTDSAKIDGAISAFSKILKQHRQLEEKELYPKLDEELTESQKQEIISHINEIPLKKN